MTIKHISDSIKRLRNLWLDEAKKEGGKVLGFFCSYVPEELLNLEGLTSFRMRATGSSGTETADIYLGCLNCGYTRHCLEMGLEKHYEFIDGFVFASCCDQLRRLHDNWLYLLKPEFAHIVDLPHVIDEFTTTWYRDELERLCSHIADHFNIPFGKDTIWKAIEETNNTRALLNAFNELRKSEKPCLTGHEMHTLSLFASSVPKAAVNKILQTLLEESKDRSLPQKYRAKVLLIGNHLDDPSFIELIEDTGALVVAESFCCGLRDQIDTVVVDRSQDPFNALARRYFSRISCPRMYGEYENRFDKIMDMLRETTVDGVIIEHLKFCEIWGVESNMIFRNLKKSGVPVLRLERDYISSSMGQIKTRIQAFIESMGK